MLPCEAAARYAVVIKAKLAKKLKKEGKSQKKIAVLLGVTEAAVSQYLSGKRAKKVSKKENVRRVPEICKHCAICRLK